MTEPCHQTYFLNMFESCGDMEEDLITAGWVEVVDQPGQEVQESCCDLGVSLHGVEHHQHCRLKVHDAVTGNVEEDPIIEKSQLDV